jgi:ribulose-phosphate 3-epimerase
MKIYPSIVFADWLDVKSVLKKFDSLCDGYHVDVMDNHFVPNLTVGAQYVNALRAQTRLPLNVHLMVDDPQDWLDKLKLEGQDYFTFHYEALRGTDEISSLISEIRFRDWNVGLAINPKTKIDDIKNMLHQVDLVQIMSVEPGFAGQAFIATTFDKIRAINAEIEKHNHSCIVSVDGGIGMATIAKLAELGVGHVGVANAIFAAQDPEKAIKDLYDACQI